MASNFPKLPGYVPLQDCSITDFKKVSHVKLEKNVNAFNKPVPLYPVPDQPQANYAPTKADASLSTSQRFFQNPSGSGDIQEQFEPTYVKLDKVVLRYFGFFKESVVESNLENWKLRQLVIFYYLEDSTVMMSEPKETNSGTPQGVFLKRQAITRADGSGETLQPEDFIVGQAIEVLGRRIVINDADSYTREFYGNTLGIEQPAQFDVPGDSFKQSQVKPPVNKDKAMKDYLEHSLGGGRVPSQKQFLDNDRKVLRFFSVYQDQPYIVHYFLSDDTLEVREVKYQNSGKDEFPLLLKRSKLPKNFAVSQPGQDTNQENFYTEADFYPGCPIQAFSKVFHITGVDDFTQLFYKEKYGRHFDTGSITTTKLPEAPKIIEPPYNGFGSEEDSLGYVYKLEPVKPKKDFFKYVDNESKILRFTAKFNTQVPEDVVRRFIIAFYLADDTISIFEPAQKNSGKSTVFHQIRNRRR